MSKRNVVLIVIGGLLFLLVKRVASPAKPAIKAPITGAFGKVSFV